MKKKIKNLDGFKNLKGFEIINIGIITGGANVTCGADADRLCSSLCPTNGCKHDGCCGGNWDARGDSACKSLGKEVAVSSTVAMTEARAVAVAVAILRN